jgi:ABC-type Fe3+ transport system substrate-binding protein
MMPKRNIFIFIFYCLVSLAVLVAALVSPLARQYASAPLRDAILPKPAPIVVNLIYSTEKDAWLTEAIPDFYATNPRLNGHPIQIKTSTMGSREMVLAVLDGTQKPDLISPASMLQISILQDQSTAKFGHPLVNVADRDNCRSVLTTPLVLVAWKERADALWGSAPPEDLWKKLHDALVDPKGWADFGHPDWGYVKFGQTSPLTSNSGFMTILLMTYNYFGKTSGLTSADILNNPDYQKWFLDTEGTISKFGDSTGTYMNDIIAYGPSMYDIVSVYEATAIEQAQNALGRDGALHIYYPPATIMSDHPFCTLTADWVSADQAQAAKMFSDYLLTKPAQELAFLKYGFRPVIPTLALDETGSPFTRYAANGLSITLPPEIETPSTDVLNTLLDFWSRNINR